MLPPMANSEEHKELLETMAAAARGEIEMTTYTSREEAYADLGLI
jgi:hypothetical protein